MKKTITLTMALFSLAFAISASAYDSVADAIKSNGPTIVNHVGDTDYVSKPDGTHEIIIHTGDTDTAPRNAETIMKDVRERHGIPEEEE